MTQASSGQVPQLLGGSVVKRSLCATSKLFRKGGVSCSTIALDSVHTRYLLHTDPGLSGTILGWTSGAW